MDAHPFPAIWRFGPFILDEAGRCLTCNGVPIGLGSRQVDTLLYLLANSLRVVAREELYSAVWPGRTVDDNNLTQAIAGLRRALEDNPGEPRLIVTVKGRGYRIGVLVICDAVTPDVKTLAPTSSDTAPPDRVTLSWRKRARHVAGLGVVTLLAGLALLRLHVPSHRDPHRIIAILPLSNLSGDAAEDYLADGITEELTDQLGRLPGLTVTGRLSARAYKGSKETPAQIAASLHATALLEGSMRRERTHLTVLVRLIDPATGYQSWAGRFDATDASLLQLQKDLAERVAAALNLRLTPSESSALSAGQTADPTALDAYLRAGQAARPGTQAALQAAINTYSIAIRHDPGFAAAFLARALALEALAEIATSQDGATLHKLTEAAEGDATQALLLAPKLGRAYLLKARLLAENHLDLKAVAVALARGRALTPGDPRAMLDAAMLEGLLGQSDQALADARVALAADPLTFTTVSDAAGVFFTIRADAEASATLDEAGALQSIDSLTDRDLRANLALSRGDIKIVRRLCEAESDWEQTLLNAIAERRGGNRAAADAATTRLHAALADTGHLQYAEIAAQSGNADGAMSFLVRAKALHDPGMLALATDRWLDPLRGRSDFQLLLRQVGFQRQH